MKITMRRMRKPHEKRNKPRDPPDPGQRRCIMPNRIIKESICTSDSVDRLSWFEEVLFYRLIVNCDDYGRFDGRPAIIKNRLFPLKESLTTKAVSEAVKTLASTGMVTLYEFEGKPYLYLPAWNDHQSVRAKRSKYPAPEPGQGADAAAGKEPTAGCAGEQRESIGKQMISDASKCPRNPIQSESYPNPIRDADAGNAPAGGDTAPADPGLARVMNLYLDRVNALPSPACIDELKAFAGSLGADVCCHAINIALDDNKASWSYIRAILQSYHRDGIRTLKDIQRREAARHAQKERARRPKPNQIVGGVTPSTKPIDMDELQRICDSL